jgi:hypothetical protein
MASATQTQASKLPPQPLATTFSTRKVSDELRTRQLSALAKLIIRAEELKRA